MLPISKCTRPYLHGYICQKRETLQEPYPAEPPIGRLDRIYIDEPRCPEASSEFGDHRIRVESQHRIRSRSKRSLAANGVTVNFPEVLEGGGIAYLEAFHENRASIGKAPFGMLVQAIGTPDILRVEWTDFNYHSLKGKKVKFGSCVLLHIYTKALYGQEVAIYLWDRDLFSPNDSLKIGKDSKFTREVNIHKVLPFEAGKEGVSDKLLRADQPQNDNKAEKESFVQKIIVQVSVDYFWRAYAGDHLKIYPSIQSKKTDAFFENFTREFLEVADDGMMCTSPQPVSSNPAMIGEVETNINAYHPCQYKMIDYINDKGETINIYKEESGVSQNAKIEIGIIAGSDPKKFSFKVDDAAETKDCSFDGKPNDHERGIFVYDKNKLPSNFVIGNHTQKSIEGTAKFDYDSNNIFNYIWPTKPVAGDFPHLNLTSVTCRHRHHVRLTIYPDVVWSLAFTFALKNPLAFTHSNLTGGKIFEEAQSKARKSGYDRYRLSQGGQVPDEFSLSLKAKWDKKESTGPAVYGIEKEYALKYSKKISDFMGVLLRIKQLAEKVKNTAGGQARSITPGLPFSFEVLSPKLGTAVEWKNELINNKISTAGLIKLTADPLIGAEFIIDMLALATKMHPIVNIIKTSLDIGLEFLGGYIKLDLKFYGQLNITIETLQINTLTGISAGSKPLMITGKMGVMLIFQLKVQGKVEAFGVTVELSFNAEAKVDAYFGGIFLVGNDASGVYADITGQFSGLLLTLKVECKIGKYTKKVNINNEPIFPSDVLALGKQYFISK